MTSNQILAIVLLVIGGVLLIMGFQSSQGVDDQVTEAVTGRFTDTTTWFFVLGAAAAVAGLGMLFVRRG